MSKRQRGPLLRSVISRPSHIIVELANLRDKEAMLRAARGRDFLCMEGGISE